MKKKQEVSSSSRKYMQGKFMARHPEKYKGDPKNIIFRSSLEFSYMMKLDHDPNVLEWSSEELAIAYVSPKDDKFHRYFPDFLVKKKDKDGIINTYMVEIKPEYQIKKPLNKTGKKATRAMINEAITYSVNNAKWAYATKYCAQRGWKFIVISEKNLFL